MPTLETLLGERLRSFRLRAGFTQRELAGRVAGGVDLSYVGRIERGEQLPSLKVLQRLARALGVSVGEFFRRGPSDRAGGAGRFGPSLWRALQQVPPRDMPILLAVARMLAQRRGTPARYRGKRQWAGMAAERRSRYRRGRATPRAVR